MCAENSQTPILLIYWIQQSKILLINQFAPDTLPTWVSGILWCTINWIISPAFRSQNDYHMHISSYVLLQTCMLSMMLIFAATQASPTQDMLSEPLNSPPGMAGNPSVSAPHNEASTRT